MVNPRNVVFSKPRVSQNAFDVAFERCRHPLPPALSPYPPLVTRFTRYPRGNTRSASSGGRACASVGGRASRGARRRRCNLVVKTPPMAGQVTDVATDGSERDRALIQHTCASAASMELLRFGDRLPVAGGPAWRGGRALRQSRVYKSPPPATARGFC